MEGIILPFRKLKTSIFGAVVAETSKLASHPKWNMTEFLFFFSLLVVFYSYIGYGIILFLIVQLKKIFGRRQTSPGADDFRPDVTLIVAAYNEESVIETKILNSLALAYPPERLHYLFVTDGSTDLTPGIIRKYGQIRLLHNPERRGKVAAVNRAMEQVKTPYVVFSDANTLLNRESIQLMIKHFSDRKVGGVAGEKRIFQTNEKGAAEAGEGIYWKYESYLKTLDSALYSVMGAAGELFALRTEAFTVLKENTIIEDFVQSMQICMAGYVIRYEPRAYATETASLSIQEEEKRKIRIAAGAFQAIVILKPLFNVFRYGVLSFQYVSHRILRWTLSPVCLITLILTNILLVYERGMGFFYVVLLCQCVFYAAAFIGWIVASMNIRWKAFYVPYYFLFMNMSMFTGFFRFLSKRQSAVWEKAIRSSGN